MNSPGNSKRQPCLVSLGQVHLSSAVRQDGPNSESPWGLRWDGTFLWEEARWADLVPHSSGNSAQSRSLFAEEDPMEERGSFYNKIPLPLGTPER